MPIIQGKSIDEIHDTIISNSIFEQYDRRINVQITSITKSFLANIAVQMSLSDNGNDKTPKSSNTLPFFKTSVFNSPNYQCRSYQPPSLNDLNASTYNDILSMSFCTFDNSSTPYMYLITFNMEITRKRLLSGMKSLEGLSASALNKYASVSYQGIFGELVSSRSINKTDCRSLKNGKQKPLIYDIYIFHNTNNVVDYTKYIALYIDSDVYPLVKKLFLNYSATAEEEPNIILH